MQLLCHQPSELSFIFPLFPVYLSEKLSGSKMFSRHQFLNPKAFFLLMINSSHLSSHPKQKGSDARVMSISCACFFAQCHPDMERLINSRASRMPLQRPLCVAYRPVERRLLRYAPNLVFMRRWNLQIIQILFVPSVVHLAVFTFFHQRPRLTDTFWEDVARRCGQ